MAKLSQNLQASGYFDEVRVDALPDPEEGRRIPVKVQLGAVKPRTMGLGVGFSTDVGPRARANWTRHWVNPRAIAWVPRPKCPRRGRTSAPGMKSPSTRR